MVLRTALVWQQNGMAKYHYAPISNYDTPYDRDPFTDKFSYDGNDYYLSFGPMMFYLPYAFMQLSGLAISNLNVQIFNLLWFLLTLICLSRLLRLLAAQYHISTPKSGDKFIKIALLGYAFSPAILWFQGNSFCHEIAVLPFLLTTIYYFARFWTTNNLKKYELFLVAINSFLMIYSDWIGVLVLAWISVFCSYNFFITNQKRFLYFIIAAVSIAAFSIGFIVWQYSLVGGFAAYCRGMQTRVATRSGFEFMFLINIIKNYMIAYLPLLLAIFIGIVLLQYKKIKLNQAAFFNPIIVLSILIILSHHFLLLEFTQRHDYSAVKSGWLIAYFFACIYYELQPLLPKKAYFLLVFIVFGGVLQYYYINRPGAYNQNDDAYAAMQEVGASIAEQSRGEEFVFVSDSDFDTPQVQFYARRTPHFVATIDSCRSFLQRAHLPKGVFFDIKNQKIIAVTHIEN